MKRSAQYGFTLIELVMVIVLFAIGATAIVAGYGQVGSSLSINSNLQSATQLARECGEYLLAERRDNSALGYTGVTGSGICSTLPNPAGLTVTVNFTDPYSGAACPGTCKLADISVSNGTNTLASSSVMLVSY